jgi:hypothetical protein
MTAGIELRRFSARSADQNSPQRRQLVGHEPRYHNESHTVTL